MNSLIWKKQIDTANQDYPVARAERIFARTKVFFSKKTI